MSKLFDVLGLGNGKSFYMRDFRNAYHLRPDVNPPRQKFNGYVNFVINRDLFGFLYNEKGEASQNEFRSQIGSLVRTAELPSAKFKTETMNAYNRKKIINTGVEYDPVSITVFDTVGNEWLTLLMKYFAYHYMNPRNKSNEGDRDIDSLTSGIGGVETIASYFTGDKFDSNKAGYNTNLSSYFFERIDYVLYHGNKGVQYSLINPVLTTFKPGTIDYASSDVMDFQMTFEYESFTVHNVTNFGLSTEDLGRFENASEIKGAVFADNKTAMQDTSLKETTLDFLGTVENKRTRAGQPLGTSLDPSGSLVERPGTALKVYGDAVTFSDAKNEANGFFGDLVNNVIDAGLTAAINGGNVRDAVIGSAASTTIAEIQQPSNGGN